MHRLVELIREKLLLQVFIVRCLCYSKLAPLFVHPRVPLLLAWLLVVCLIGGCFNCAPVALALVADLRGKLKSPHACVIDVPQFCSIRSIWPNALLNLNDLWLSFCNTLFKRNN